MNVKLRLLRGERSQKFVARKLGINESTYRMIELRGSLPRSDLLFRMADFFDTPAEKLFPQIENMRTQGKRMKLIETRWRLGLTLGEAAKCIGISEGYLKKVEAGKANPALDYQSKYEEFYGIPMTELFPDLHQ